MLITKAAIMYANGEIVEGRSYGYIASIARKLSYGGEKIEGFVTSTGDFVLPVEAAVIATNSKQIEPGVASLTPEHLWPEKETVE